MQMEKMEGGLVIPILDVETMGMNEGEGALDRITFSTATNLYRGG